VNARRRAVALALLLSALIAAAAFMWFARARPTPAAPPLVAFDSTLPARETVPCPSPGPGTRVLFVLGQSNAGNHARPADPPRAPRADVLEFRAGRCTVARDPLLGATGRDASPWPALADRIVDAGHAQRVVLVVFAVAGAPIERLAPPGGALSAAWLDEVAALRRQGLTPDAVIWLQGEADHLRATPADRYERGLLDVLNGFRQQGVRAPLYVSVATRCGTPWRPDNPVAQAQAAVVRRDAQLREGVNMDRLLSEPAHRYDDCHLARDSVAALADAWLRVLHPR
jgi:hypothetical protein